MIQEKIRQPKTGFNMGFGFSEEGGYKVKGEVFITLDGVETKLNNVYTLDGSILGAMLFSGLTVRNPIKMLAVGTGATGTAQVPSVADERQRKLNTEIKRKAFSSVVYRDELGAITTVPTRIVDFTTVFNEGEAVGALNEMGLVSPYSLNPATTTPVSATFPEYDEALNLTNKDILINYLTFPVINKPSQSVLAITWRLTF
jgi:hypothetical protein